MANAIHDQQTHHIGSRTSERECLISFEEAAARLSMSRKTLYEWKRNGKLRREHGLRVVGSAVRIDWSAFKACIEKGGLS
ncbi:MAG: helix-turn-helix domain-containing protein [Candidatus Binataceae bacterium]